MSRRIGCKNLYYALVTKTETGVTYGTPIRLKKLISIKTTDQYAEYKFYSDDSTEEASSKLTGSEIEIELGSISNADKAIITGASFSETTGKFVRKTGDSAPTLALLWEITRSDGDKSDFRVLYRCTLSIQESENTTVEDGRL